MANTAFDKTFMTTAVIIAIIYTSIVIIINKLLGKEAAGVAGVALTALAAAAFKQLEGRKSGDPQPGTEESTSLTNSATLKFSWWKTILIAFLFSGMTNVLIDLMDGIIPMIFHPTKTYYADFGHINGKLINHYTAWEQSIKCLSFLVCGVIATKALKLIPYSIIIISALFAIVLDFYMGTLSFIFFGTHTFNTIMMDMEDYKYSYLWIVFAFLGSYISQEKNMVTQPVSGALPVSYYVIKRNKMIIGTLGLSLVVFLIIWYIPTQVQAKKNTVVEFNDPFVKFLFLGNKEIDNQNYSLALLYFDSAIAINSREPATFYNKGYCLYQLDSLESAIKALNMSLSLDHAKPEECFRIRGNCYYFLGNCKEAIKDYNETIRLNPDDDYTYYFRGSCFKKMENYDNAIEDYSRYIVNKPSDPDGYYNRALCYFEQQKYDLSVKDFNQALILNSTQKDIHSFRGESYYQLKEYNISLEDFNKTIESDPTNSFAYNRRGEIKYYLNIADYCDDFSKASDLSNETGQANYETYCSEK